MKLIYLLTLVLVGLAILASPASADGVPPLDNEQALTSLQFWAFVLGSLVPLAGYAINKHAWWVSEPTKVLVQVLLAAAAGAVYQMVEAGGFKLDTEHLQTVVLAVFGAFVAHHGVYKPGHISQRLGGGQNAQGQPLPRG